MLSRGTWRLLVPLYRAHIVTSNVRSLADSTTAGDYEENKPVVDRFAGVGQPFGKEVAEVLSQKVDETMVTIQRGGIVELPISYYHNVLNVAFGHGGWALVPVGDIIELELGSSDQPKEFVQLIREYALYCNGRFISQCYGETGYYKGKQSFSASTENIKNIALTRCCKDLGMASELWDKDWVAEWQKKHAVLEWTKNVTSNSKKQFWKKKGDVWKWPFEASTYNR